MRARQRSSGSSSRVRFLGSEADRAHARWFRTIADHYDRLYDPKRASRAYLFLHDLFRRRGPVTDVLDVACGTFALDLPLVKRGYAVVGRDLSTDMLRVARRNLREAGRTADIAEGDMRSLRLDRTFDAVLCLGTAFNYLSVLREVESGFRTMRRHLRSGGLLVLDLTNFDAWIRNPRNACVEVDYRAKDDTRIAIFAFNEQSPDRKLHYARVLTAVQRKGKIDMSFDEAPLRVWTKATLARELTRHSFRPVEWHGELRFATKYRARKSPRLVSVSIRE